MTKLIAALACMACAYLPAPALAATHADDAAATRAYLRAENAYEDSAYPALSASVAAMDARINKIAGECPSALTYAPRDAAFGELGEEAFITMFVAGLAPEQPMLLRLSGVIARLRWSDHRLSRLVHAEADEERAIVTLALPDMCADIAAWKASAYAALPPSAVGFLAHVQAIESSSIVEPREELREAVIMRLLRPYEGPAERRTAERVRRLGVLVTRRLAVAALTAGTKLAAGLGVSAL